MANTPSVTGLLGQVRDGQLSVSAATARALRRIAAADGELRAFARYDEARALSQAEALDARAENLPLKGLPLAVKDLIDTHDFGTEYGSPIYAGHHPAADAGIVRRCREAGAVIVGKTVTTEFALSNPAVTRNPHDSSRTPGGSSSGSAVAVAAGLVPAALGTQTSGSVIRPASYCGVVGFKPSFAGIDRYGVKLLCPSFDTVGLFAGNVTDIVAVFDAVRLVHPPARPLPPIIRIGLCRTAAWDRVDPDAQRAFDQVATLLARDERIEILTAEIDDIVEETTQAQIIQMEWEVAGSLAYEYEHRRHLLSARLRHNLDTARRRTSSEATHAAGVIAGHRRALPARLATVDAVLTPAVTGVAPARDTTGDPWFCRAWTALHVPAISLPLATGRQGLPIGIQLVGANQDDDSLLATAAIVAEATHVVQLSDALPHGT